MRNGGPIQGRARGSDSFTRLKNTPVCESATQFFHCNATFVSATENSTMAIDTVPPLIYAQLNYLLTHSPIPIKVNNRTLIDLGFRFFIKRMIMFSEK